MYFIKTKNYTLSFTYFKLRYEGVAEKLNLFALFKQRVSFLTKILRKNSTRLYTVLDKNALIVSSPSLNKRKTMIL